MKAANERECARMVYLTVREAAEYLRVAKSTLDADRCRGQLGIPFCKVGAAVRYRRQDLDEWMNRHCVQPV